MITMNFKEIKAEIKEIAVFLFNFSIWAWQFLVGINLIIMLCAPHTDNLLVLGINFFFGIFLMKSYLYYSMLEKKVFFVIERELDRFDSFNRTLEGDFMDYRKDVDKRFDEVNAIFEKNGMKAPF